MKICGRCKIGKPLTDFYKSGRMKDGLQSSCKGCMAESYKRSRANKIEHYRQVQRDRGDRNLERYKEWRETLKCSQCGEPETCCLDLHHLDPNEKEANISDVTRYWGWERIMEEASKCIVVCANCHRKIHAGVIQIGA